ncbi:glyoxylate reductase [Fictibacillus enclensis]|uniref:D-glycerate dehydrogenase n=1 Tax=Fictibacillus enclensis TaxID=1017270 RepID=A0A0V8JBU6_9BACL|nr:D-glycerate dehydrogenase [Fictibacillus enclensis]KSU84467.1 D-glycerate dehydrogenase [Fictibacillus enclensis]SCB79966.1 glyoxylate reductase [Fictibacillus enclensis]
MKPKVYITRKIPKEVAEQIAEVCYVRMWEEEDIPVPRPVLQKELADSDGLYCLLTENIDSDLLDNAPRLRVISNMAVGYNNIDIETASERGIMVTNTPSVLTQTTADLTFALLMATSRRIVESSDFLRRGEWKTWSPMLLTGQDVYGSTLGIIGLGQIGESVAQRAKGFDMRVLYYNRSRKLEAEKQLGIQYTDMETLLKESDFICILTPLTPETRHLIGRKELSLMKNTSVLINTARGGIVDEEALYDALKEKEIWAAGLDVFEQEPVSMDHPLFTLSNVVTLPHIGSASFHTRMQMARLAAENLLTALLGDIPKNLVNANVLSK